MDSFVCSTRCGSKFSHDTTRSVRSTSIASGLRRTVEIGLLRLQHDVQISKYMAAHSTLLSARLHLRGSPKTSVLGRYLPFLESSSGSTPAGQDVTVRWSHPMQMAGQVECKQVVKSVQLTTKALEKAFVNHRLRGRGAIEVACRGQSRAPRLGQIADLHCVPCG